MKFDEAKQHLNVEIFIEWYMISCDRCLCLGDGGYTLANFTFWHYMVNNSHQWDDPSITKLLKKLK